MVSTNSTEKFRVLTGDTVMAPSIQVFVQVALLFCVVTTSMGGITDLHKTVSELETKVKVSQEEIKSLHQLIEQLEKRLQRLEAKGEFGGVQIQPVVSTLIVITIPPIEYNYYNNAHVFTSLYDIFPCEWQESTVLNTIVHIHALSFMHMHVRTHARTHTHTHS